MNLTGIREGDIVRVDKKGRRFHAVVEAKEGRELKVLPLQKNISYRTATSREVCDHWRKSRRRSEPSTKEGGR